MPTPTNDLTFDEYAEKAHTTAIYPGADADPLQSVTIPLSHLGIMYCSLKLAGEAGEISEKVGKWIRDGVAWDDMRNMMFGELGDPLWYLQELCRHFGFTLADVANGNRAKLLDRQARGKLHGSGDNR